MIGDNPTITAGTRRTLYASLTGIALCGTIGLALLRPAPEPIRLPRSQIVDPTNCNVNTEGPEALLEIAKMGEGPRSEREMVKIETRPESQAPNTSSDKTNETNSKQTSMGTMFYHAICKCSIYSQHELSTVLIGLNYVFID